MSLHYYTENKYKRQFLNKISVNQCIVVFNMKQNLNYKILTGEFLRVRSHTQGEAFSLTLDLDTPLATVPNQRYFISLYTLISCPKVGCSDGKDSISVKLKDGVNGTYREIYTIKRISDTKWIKESFNFIATQSRTYVKIFLICFHLIF